MRLRLTSPQIDARFAHDLIQAATRVNYASNLEKIHGLETMVRGHNKYYLICNIMPC